MAAPALSHFGIHVTDGPRMEDFYTRVLGLLVTDRGSLPHGPTLTFLSHDPDQHHQLVLVTGRPAGVDYNVVNQISFKVSTLEELKVLYARMRAEDLGLGRTELPGALQAEGDDVLQSCRRLAPLVVRAVYETEPLTASGAWRPWGLRISAAFSKQKALSQFARQKQRHASLLEEVEPFVLPERNLSRGRRYMYMVQIGADSRKEADGLCAQLRKEGGACAVRKN